MNARQGVSFTCISSSQTPRRAQVPRWHIAHPHVPWPQNMLPCSARPRCSPARASACRPCAFWWWLACLGPSSRTRSPRRASAPVRKKLRYDMICMVAKRPNHGGCQNDMDFVCFAVTWKSYNSNYSMMECSKSYLLVSYHITHLFIHRHKPYLQLRLG